MGCIVLPLEEYEQYKKNILKKVLDIIDNPCKGCENIYTMVGCLDTTHALLCQIKRIRSRILEEIKNE